jgi:hypothetical protein
MRTELHRQNGLNNSLCLNKRSGVNNLLFPVKLGPFVRFVQARVFRVRESLSPSQIVVTRVLAPQSDCLSQRR